MTRTFDVIVIGARCAGSPTGMLLARQGYRVLVVDRATFPSDTVSTHILHPLGVRALGEWGLLDRLKATGCPPIHTYAFDFGPITLAGAPGTDGIPGRLLSAAHRPRQAAGRCRRRIRSGGPRGLHGRRDPDRGWVRGRGARPLEAWRRHHRAGGYRRRCRRQALLRRRYSSARGVRPEAALARGLLFLLERAADGRPVRNLHPRETRLCGGSDS